MQADCHGIFLEALVRVGGRNSVRSEIKTKRRCGMVHAERTDGMANGRGSSTSVRAFALSALSSRTIGVSHKGGVIVLALGSETSGKRMVTRLNTQVFFSAVS